MKAFAVILSLATLAVCQTPQQPPAPNSNDSPACAEAKILAAGIALNIEVQQQEQANLAVVAKTLQANPVNMQDFQVAKSNLLAFVSDGIQIRQANQLVAPSSNPATQGLAVVANAQLTELQKVAGLTGNPSQDNSVISSLQGDFSGGIQQNMKNQQAALTGCP